MQNIKGNAVKNEAKEFAPELKQTEETRKEEAYTKDLETLANEMYHRSMQGLTPGENINVRAKASVVQTKYSRYTLPNGKNYREILIQAPSKKTTEQDLIKKGFSFKQDKNQPEGFTAAYNQNGAYLGTHISKEKAINEITKRYDLEHGFKSPHWNESNVLAHLRMNDRTIPDKANSPKITGVKPLPQGGYCVS